MASTGATNPAGRLETPGGAFDLERFLKELNDGKLEQLREGVEREARRRGLVQKPPKAEEAETPRSQRRTPARRNPPRVESALTVGQERLARAALAAGASPAAVAKELGIGRAQVARFAKTMKTGRPPRT